MREDEQLRQTMNSFFPYNTSCCAWRSGSLLCPWSSGGLWGGYLALRSFRLLFSGLKVPRLLKWGRSSPSCSAVSWVDKGNLDRRWKRRDGAEECVQDEETEDTVEQESTESSESGCLCSVRLTFPWDFLGRVAANVGLFSEGQRTIMWSWIYFKK